MKNRAFLLVISALLILFGYLLFKNIGSYSFWDDEANTAIFAKNLKKTGELAAFDGRNLISYSNGIELDANLNNVVIPPLQYYVAAWSISLLGESNFSVRFPFAFMGLLCFLLFLLINIELTNNRRLIILNLFIFATNSAFILYMRQSRYYAPTAFFFLLNLLLLIRYFKTSNKFILVGYVASSFLLFLTQYSSALGILSTLGFCYMMHKKWKLKNQEVLFFMAANLLIGAFIIGYLITHNPFDAITRYPGKGLNIGYKFYVFFKSFVALDMQTFFSLLLLFFYYVGNRFESGKWKIPSELRQLLLFLLINLAFFSLFSVKYAIRYVVYLAPVAIAIEGYIIYQIASWKINYARVIAGVLLVLLSFTSITFLTSRNEREQKTNTFPIHSYLIEYIKEIHNEQPTSYSVLVDYFHRKNEKDHTLLVYPRYMTYPLMYYLGKEYLFTDQLDKTMKVNKQLPEYIYNNSVEPNYLVICGPDIKNIDKIKSQYQSSYKLEETINFFYQDVTRPEYNWRSFDVVTNFNRESESIYIYKKN